MTVAKEELLEEIERLRAEVSDLEQYVTTYCPTPAEKAERDQLLHAAGWQDAANRALDAAARTSISSAELATMREALTPGGGS